MAAEFRHLAEDPSFDVRPARWRIGLIALATDHTSERDFMRMCPGNDVAVYVNRVAYTNPTTAENLLRMQPHLSEAARLILPYEDLDAIAYSCTAASVLLGDDAVTAAIQDAKPGVPCITPAAAARAAFEHLNVRHISVLTPYLRSVSEPFVGYFEDRGLAVLSLACMGIEDDRKMARVSLDSIAAAALEACHPDAEALFISCTALRAAEVAGRIEGLVERPVVTSNQAMIWRSLRVAGCPQTVDGYGRLLRS